MNLATITKMNITMHLQVAQEEGWQTALWNNFIFIFRTGNSGIV
jgi:hypothetical protein